MYPRRMIVQSSHFWWKSSCFVGKRYLNRTIMAFEVGNLNFRDLMILKK
jgi:hypothetical protein